MYAIGRKFMLTICLAALTLPAIELSPQRPTEEISSAGELYNAYRWYGLPLPPRFAKPVQWQYYYAVRGGNQEGQYVKYESCYRVGWLLTEGDSKTLPQILLPGSEVSQAGYYHGRYESFSVTECLKHVESDSIRYSTIEIIAGLWHLGKRVDAKLLYREWSKSVRAKTDKPNVDAELQEVREEAWDHWCWAHLRSTISFCEINSRLQRIAGDDTSAERTLHEDFENIRESLEISMKPGIGRRGQPGELVDRLVDYPPQPGFFPEINAYFFDDAGSVRTFDFDSVPVLIAHLDDERWTRRYYAFNKSVSTITVGDVCRSILIGLSRSSLDWNTFNTLSTGEQIKYVYDTWYTRAKAMGEEAWCATVLDSNGKCRVSNEQIAILQLKYPHRLPAVLDDCLKHDCYHAITPTLNAILRSTLSKEAKSQAIERVLASHDESSRCLALVILKQHDRSALKASLLRELQAVPPVSLNMHCNYGRIGDYGGLCAYADDPEVWKAFERTLPSLNPTFRNYAYERTMDICHETGRHPRTMLGPIRLLLNALNHAGVDRRPDFNTFSWPHMEYKVLSVQNYAALKLAWIYDIPIDYKPDRTPEEWEKIRTSIQNHVADILKTQSE